MARLPRIVVPGQALHIIQRRTRGPNKGSEYLKKHKYLGLE